MPVRCGPRVRPRALFRLDDTDLGIGDLNVQRHVGRAAQTPDVHALLGSDFAVPVLQPVLNALQMALDPRPAKVIPEPAGQQPQRAVEPIAKTKGVKRLGELAVDFGDDAPEFLLWEQWVQDFGVEIGKCRREVALDHPVPADANDASRCKFFRLQWHMRVQMRIAGM